jgi:hypothetical protein
VSQSDGRSQSKSGCDRDSDDSSESSARPVEIRLKSHARFGKAVETTTLAGRNNFVEYIDMHLCIVQ